jgi:hypothetical protein
MSLDDDEPESDPTPDRSRHTRSWEADGSVSTSIVEAVADVSGKSHEDLTPFFETVDPDALDQVLTSLRGNGLGEVRFGYSGFLVVVKADGTIEIQSLD